jgi:Rrf2 family protein
MTVIFSKKCELGLQAVLFLSTHPNGKLFNSSDIAAELKIPKEFVSKVLQSLTNSGIVGSKKGKAGGFYLAKEPKNIRLIDIVEAIDGLEVFFKCVLGFPGCSSTSPCPVHERWGTLRDQAIKMLSSETLADLRETTFKKIQSI